MTFEITDWYCGAGGFSSVATAHKVIGGADLALDALACFRFAERMANESSHGQDDVRWAITFHEMLALKLEEDPDRTWHRDDWTQLAEPCLGLAPSNGTCRQDTVDLARLAYVGVAARQIARGRAGEAPQAEPALAGSPCGAYRGATCCGAQNAEHAIITSHLLRSGSASPECR